MNRKPGIWDFIKLVFLILFAMLLFKTDDNLDEKYELIQPRRGSDHETHDNVR